MATPSQVRAWIRQVEVDLAAAGVDAEAIAECHRRYFIQQSYEKAIKALALMLWKGSDDEMREFDKLFLGQHSPLKSLGDAASPLSKSLFHLGRRVMTFLSGVDNADLHPAFQIARHLPRSTNDLVDRPEVANAGSMISGKPR